MTTPPPFSSHQTSNMANGDLSIPPVLSKREQRLDKAMRYFSSIVFVITIIIACVFAGVELHYGLQYRHQCPMEPGIDLFLIVHGATKIGWVIFSILLFIDAKVIYGIMNKKSLARLIMLPLLVVQIVFALWFLAWFITGNVWVFSNHGRVQYTDTTNKSTYCQETLYKAAFGLIITTYIVTGIIIILTIKRRVIGKKVKQKLASNFDDSHKETSRF